MHSIAGLLNEDWEELSTFQVKLQIPMQSQETPAVTTTILGVLLNSRTAFVVHQFEVANCPRLANHGVPHTEAEW